MKNETVGTENQEGKVGLTAATLPWWAKVLIAEHVKSAFPPSASHSIHHCSDRKFSTNTTSPSFSDLCPDCIKKNSAPQGGN